MTAPKPRWSPYQPRSHQAALHKEILRFSVLVCHRRFGKTVLAVNELIDRSLRCERDEPRHAYLAPLRKQAKRVAWDYLKRFTAHVPDRVVREGELRVDLSGGRRIFVDGADNPDALRGLYLDGVVLDEYGQMQPSVWSQVVRPALSDRQGKALFIGTPKGRNAFHDLYQEATAKMAAGDGDWFAALRRASDTGVIPPAELEAARRDMDEDEFAQEFECSFAAGIVGAYYAKLLADVERENRIGNVPWEPALPVHTAWDLGIGDSTAIWFVQQTGRELRWIDYHESAGVGLDYYARVLGAKPYVYGEHLLPHDAAARELGTGRTRIEMLASLGIRGRIVARHAVDDGIQALRALIPRAWFDAAKCARGLEALRAYRRAWDERLGLFRARPLHDWASHGADAARTAAMGLREARDRPAPQRAAIGDYDIFARHPAQAEGDWDAMG